MTRLERLIRRKLKNAKRSQRAFAADLGVDPSTFSKILKGTRQPTLELADALEQALGIPAHRFIANRRRVPKRRRLHDAQPATVTAEMPRDIDGESSREVQS